jgi:heme/copper-type cytochrome/quinol oxidase subunit 2
MRQIAILVAAGVVVVGGLTGCGHEQSGTNPAPGARPAGGSAAPAAVRVINVTVRGGKVSGDTGRITVPLGTPVVMSVSSDVTDEIHVHGYNRKAKVPAGTTASVTFIANNPGGFEVELEHAKLQLLQLQVS